MKKILIVSQVFYPENSLLNDFALAIKEKGFEVSILTQHPSYPFGKVFSDYENLDYKKEEWNGIQVHRFKVIEGYKESRIKKIQNYLYFIKTGKKILLQLNENYDHILVYQVGPLTVALPALNYAAIKKIPVTLWTFDLWPDTIYGYGIPKVFPISTYLNSLVRSIYQRSQHIIVSSKLFIDEIQKYIPNQKIEYAPNWLISQENKKSNVQLPVEKFNFIFTGNISISQNLEKVLVAWKIADLKEAMLHIVGDGSKLSALKLLVTQENIKSVIFHGWQASDEINDILAQSDALVMSLISSNGVDKTEPFKLQSYINAGKPVLGAMFGAGKEIIKESDIGEYADPDDENAIATQFKAIYNYSEERLLEIKANSLQLMNQRFDRSTIIDRVMAIVSKN